MNEKELMEQIGEDEELTAEFIGEFSDGREEGEEDEQ